MNEISKQLMCVMMRNNVELWFEDETIKNLKALLLGGSPPQFILAPSGQVINRVDIVGIFTPLDLEEHNHRKNGQWKCVAGTWHPKFDECDCRKQEILDLEEYLKKNEEYDIPQLTYTQMETARAKLAELRAGNRIKSV